MNRQQLQYRIAKLAEGADASVSLLMQDIDSGEAMHAYHADAVVSAASTIKVPLMIATLQQVQAGQLALSQSIDVPSATILPDSEVFEDGGTAVALWELLYWMIVNSDNTATNVLIDRVGYAAVDDLCTTLGCRNTALRRKMLDFDARRANLDNTTSATDMALCFGALYQDGVLGETLRSFALDCLRRQRSFDLMLRWIADPVTLAHKTGGLDPESGHDRVVHDAGVFELPNRRYYLGIFVTDAPDDRSYGARLIARVSKEIYTAYQ